MIRQAPSGNIPHELALAEKLRQLTMSFMADAFEQQTKDPNADLRTFLERFSDIVDAEWTARYDKKVKRYLKKATLRYPQADFDQTLYDPTRKLDTTTIERLSACKWVDEGKNLLITGLTGSGKTYLSNALCVAAIRQFRSVKYIRANTLLLELEQARLKSTYLDCVRTYTSVDLLVVDDFGLMELDPDKCRDLFEVIDGRDGRRSTVIVSQLPVSSWFDLFKEQTYADACLSRLTDTKHCHRLEMNGVNMRGERS